MKKKQSLTTIELQKKIIRGILTVGALTLLIIFLFGNHGLYQLYILKKERRHIQDKINLLREEKMALENEKTKLQTDYKHIEEIAREKYRMSKKGKEFLKSLKKKTTTNLYLGYLPSYDYDYINLFFHFHLNRHILLH